MLLLYPYGPMEMRVVYWAVASWVCATGISYLRVTPVDQVLMTNRGLILRSVRTERTKKQSLVERDLMDLRSRRISGRTASVTIRPKENVRSVDCSVMG